MTKVTPYENMFINGQFSPDYNHSCNNDNDDDDGGGDDGTDKAQQDTGPPASTLWKIMRRFIDSVRTTFPSVRCTFPIREERLFLDNTMRKKQQKTDAVSIYRLQLSNWLGSNN